MTVYATNTPGAGYQLGGSFGSLHEAQARAESRGERFSHWWCDEDWGDRPEWVGFGPAGAQRNARYTLRLPESVKAKAKRIGAAAVIAAIEAVQEVGAA